MFFKTGRLITTLAIGAVLAGMALAAVTSAQKERPLVKDIKTSIAQKMIMLKQDVLRMDVCYLPGLATRSISTDYIASSKPANTPTAAVSKTTGVWAWKLDVCADNAEDAYQKALQIITVSNSPANIRMIANKIIRSQDCLERLPERGLVKRTNFFVEIIASCDLMTGTSVPSAPRAKETTVSPAATSQVKPAEPPPPPSPSLQPTDGLEVKR